jgi:hypothetical protein
MKAYWKERHPMGRIGQPQEVARRRSSWRATIRHS